MVCLQENLPSYRISKQFISAQEVVGIEISQRLFRTLGICKQGVEKYIFLGFYGKDIMNFGISADINQDDLSKTQIFPQERFSPQCYDG